MPEYIYKLEEADRADESFFRSFTEYSLWTVIVRRYVYFKDWFCGGLSFRNEVFVLVTTWTKTPKFAATFYSILTPWKDRTEDKLTG